MLVPRAWGMINDLQQETQLDLLRPFVNSLHVSLKELEAKPSAENMQTVDRDMNLLAFVVEGVWRWKEDPDPWGSPPPSPSDD